MSLTPCTIRVTRQSAQAVYASASLLKSLGIAIRQPVLLSLGSNSLEISVKRMNRPGNHLIIPNIVAAKLKLPHSGNCLAVKRGSREIRIGPLIGLLTTVSSNGYPFGSRNGLMRQFIDSGKGKSFYFAFSPRNVNWGEESIIGYFPQASGGWLKRKVPLPDVIYNRLPSRRAEKLMSINHFKERFIKRNIPIFNWSFFEKWDIYKLLQNDSAYRYVPESYINPSAKQIRDLMEKHQFIYLKPTGGSLGIGIYRLTYNPRRGYFARFRRNGKNVLVRYSRFDDLMKMLFRANRGKMEHYVAQQGIRLIELDSCPIDFRFHMTKNGKNNWVVSAIGAKKAGKGSVTTHIRNGGQIMTPERVLDTVFGSRASHVLQNARETAINLAEAIERNYPHTLGELGFDIGIDKSERIWMFEANAKPGRSIFKHPSLKMQGKDSLVNLFEHCLFLSKFRSGRDE